MMEISRIAMTLCHVTNTFARQEPAGSECPLDVSSGPSRGHTEGSAQPLAQGGSLVGRVPVHRRISNIQLEERLDLTPGRKGRTYWSVEKRMLWEGEGP